MLYGKGRWTLICYAGSASEASIDSRPVGSELDAEVDTPPSKSQVRRHWDALPDLRDWGYAPGYYSICCADCQNVSIADKRAIRCFACALAISKEDGR